jgi:exopolyphosphatase/guanosine-5'-triphosphate,3'-diphosphate pyrophosphatase
MWAVMDIGTNSTRLLVAEYDKQTGQLQVLKRALKITRIGEGMSADNRTMSSRAIERTIRALEGFAEMIAAYSPVDRVRLVATQAVREAVNQDELVKKIKERLGWVLEVIPGEEEAKLSYQGAVQGLKTASPSLVVDIGGGSTEFLLGGERYPEEEKQAELYGRIKLGEGRLQVCSLPLGALRLLENPVSNTEIAKFLVKGLKNFFLPMELSLVAVGGTATTLAAVKLGLVSYDAEKVQGLTLELSEIKHIYEQLQALQPIERLQVPGITPGREDIIIPGLQILLCIMGFLQSTSVTISDQDLLQGLILTDFQ